jgi:hypothetical protein
MSELYKKFDLENFLLFISQEKLFSASVTPSHKSVQYLSTEAWQYKYCIMQNLSHDDAELHLNLGAKCFCP